MDIETENAARPNLEEIIEDMTVESWRFCKLFQKLLTQVEAGHQSRYQNQFRYFLKRLEQNLESAEMHIVNLEGQPFDPGLAATAINLEDFEANATLVVDQMVEPTIMGKNGVIRAGSVILREVKS